MSSKPTPSASGWTVTEGPAHPPPASSVSATGTSQQQPHPPPDLGSTSQTVHIQYVPVTMTESEFDQLLRPSGVFLRVRICGNVKKEQNWIYSFVEYDSEAAAQSLIKRCHGMRLGPFKLACQLSRAPIVDRLNSDWTPQRPRCTFAERYPERSLKDHIRAQANMLENRRLEKAGQDPATAVMMGGMMGGRENSNGLSSMHMPSSTASSVAGRQEGLILRYNEAMKRSIQSGLHFARDQNQSHYFEAANQAQVALNIADELAEGVDQTTFPFLGPLFRGEDRQFNARLLQAALCVQHGTYATALAVAHEALQAIPPVTLVAAFRNAAGGQGMSPVFLNHIVTFGVLLEPVATLASRAFLHTAQHRAALEKYAPNPQLDEYLDGPIRSAVSIGGEVASAPLSLLRVLEPRYQQQEMLGPTAASHLFFSHFAAAISAGRSFNPNIFATACITAYTL